MASRIAIIVVIALATLSGAFADDTLINRRVLEGQAGWKDVIRHVKAYEIHDFSNHESTRRVLAMAGEESLDYDLHVLGRRMTLQLKRYDSLFAQGYKHHYMDENSNVLRSEDKPNCIYSGAIAGDAKSSATVSLCGGLVHATVYHDDKDQSFSIQPLDVHQQESTDHVVYRHLDLLDTNRYCGVDRDDLSSIVPVDEGDLRRLLEEGHHDDDHHNHEHHRIRQTGGDLMKPLRVDVSSTRRSLDSATKFVGVSVVNDKTRYDDKLSTVHQHSAYLFATVNNLYGKLGVDIASTFEVQLEIVSMYTFANADPWTYSPVPAPTSSPNPVPNNVRTVSGEPLSGDLLDVFNTWRASNVLPVQSSVQVDGADIAHLLTGKRFAGSTIGLAHVSGLCNLFTRSGETQATEITDAHQASTITHEIGHNLGAQHTDTPPPSFSSCLNANGEQIMSASSGFGFTNWEACSVEYFRRFFTSAAYTTGSSGYSKCAETHSSAEFDGNPVCGDGLVQAGEQCDCLNNDCAGIDDCCDGATCQLVVTAECSSLDACCTASCTIVTDTNQVCRNSVGSCDFEETCNGVDAACPADTFEATGVACTTTPNGFSGTCYKKECFDMGQECTTRGLDNPVSSAWDSACSATDETTSNANDCVVTCKKGAGGCEQYVVPQYYADGTQCDVGKACYKGTCTTFAQIPTQEENPNCFNGVLDTNQNETDVDCGGPTCFGCAAKQFCFADSDCLFPSKCNTTELYDANGYSGLGKCAVGGTYHPTPASLVTFRPTTMGPTSGAETHVVAWFVAGLFSVGTMLLMM